MPETKIHCDSCDRLLVAGERYIETLVARMIVGEPPPMYAAKLYTCETCENAKEEGCPCVGTPEQEECPRA